MTRANLAEEFERIEREHERVLSLLHRALVAAGDSPWRRQRIAASARQRKAVLPYIEHLTQRG
jgi:hypothetical protein